MANKKLNEAAWQYLWLIVLSTEVFNFDSDCREAVHCCWDPLVPSGNPPICLRVPLINADPGKYENPQHCDQVWKSQRVL